MDHHAVREVIPKTLIPYDLPMPREMRDCPLYPVYHFPPIPLGVPDLDWSVSIPGWRLAIEGGVIRGMIKT